MVSGDFPKVEGTCGVDLMESLEVEIEHNYRKGNTIGNDHANTRVVDMKKERCHQFTISINV